MTALVFGFPDGMTRSCVTISVYNDGRLPVQVLHWSLTSASSIFSFGGGGEVWTYGPERPAVLEPGGAPLIWHVDYFALRDFANRKYPDETHKIRVRVNCGSKSYRSREFVYLDLPQEDGRMPDRRSWLTRLRARLDASLFAYFAVDKATSEKRWHVTATSGYLGARNVRLDIVPEDGLDNDAKRAALEIFPPVKYRYFWWRRTISIPASDLDKLPRNHRWEARVRYKPLLGRGAEYRLILS
ncbi:hypothetical protein Aglo02_35440 [Actinokineospora globicatena]|nr:hypothetical protein Aglo02_35440 [Actinokineospora globicatena]